MGRSDERMLFMFAEDAGLFDSTDAVTDQSSSNGGNDVKELAASSSGNRMDQRQRIEAMLVSLVPLISDKLMRPKKFLCFRLPSVFRKKPAFLKIFLTAAPGNVQCWFFLIFFLFLS